MKCAVCGYEKLGWGLLETPIKNTNKKIRKETIEYADRDPEKEEFIKIHGSFHKQVDGCWGAHKIEVEIFACPECKTLQIE